MWNYIYIRWASWYLITFRYEPFCELCSRSERQTRKLICVMSSQAIDELYVWRNYSLHFLLLNTYMVPGARFWAVHISMNIEGRLRNIRDYRIGSQGIRHTKLSNSSQRKIVVANVTTPYSIEFVLLWNSCTMMQVSYPFSSMTWSICSRIDQDDQIHQSVELKTWLILRLKAGLYSKIAFGL